MQKSAQELYDQFHGKIVVVIKTNGEKWIGSIMLKVGPKPPVLLEFDLIEDLVAYKKDPVNYQPKHKMLPPDDIDSIREYDITDEPVYIKYADYLDFLSSGDSVYLSEVIENIKNNKIYVVNHEGILFRIILGKDDNVTLEEIAD
jgi:hypothetical protein